MSDVLNTEVGEEVAVAEATEQKPAMTTEELESRALSAAMRGDDLEALFNELNGPNVESEVPAEGVDDDTPVVPEETPEEVPAVTPPVAPVAPVVDKTQETIARQEAMIQKLLAGKSTAPAQFPTQPTTTETQTQAKELNVQLPVAPEYPDLPEDEVDYSAEDFKKKKKYDKDLNGYVVEQNKVIQTLASKVSETSVVVEDVNTLKLDRQSEVEKIQQERAVETAWNERRALQRKNPALSTERDLLDIHKDLGDFSKRLAAANGIAFTGDVQQFENAKAVLVQQYMSGDDNVVALADAAKLEKPEGADSYFAIAAVERYRNENELTNITLDKAYLLSQYENGTLDAAMNDIAVTEREQANRDNTQAVIEARSKVQIPNPSEAVGGDDTTGVALIDNAKLTAEESAKAMQIYGNPVAMTAPENQALIKKINDANGLS